MTDALSIKEWADRKYVEHKKDIDFYISEGVSKKDAFYMVMESSTLGAGYKAQMRKDVGLSIFD